MSDDSTRRSECVRPSRAHVRNPIIVEMARNPFDVARALIRGPFARVAKRLPTFVPPPEFASRIVKLDEGSATVDNSLYDDQAHAASWHSDDTSHDLATLKLLNAARIPYFDRVWRSRILHGPAREGRYLEIGCGGGIATGALAELGYHMTGVEPAAASLEAAREHAARLGLQERMHFVQGDAYDLSVFPEESFDGVLMADVLEHLYDLPAAVAQAWRVLRPGGILTFDTINRTYASYVLAIALAQEGIGMVPPNTHDWRLFIKPHELTFLLQAHGFLVDSSHFRGMAPTVALRNPIMGAIRLATAAREGKPLPLPLSDFVEISSLEVQYLGYAQKPSSAADGKGEAADLSRMMREANIARGKA